jgi:hypothetical protein
VAVAGDRSSCSDWSTFLSARGLVLGVVANALKAGGRGTTAQQVQLDHWAPQKKVTASPIAACRSPITNEPPTVTAPMRNVQEVVAVLPPPSMIVVVTVNGPVEV